MSSMLKDSKNRPQEEEIPTERRIVIKVNLLPIVAGYGV